MTKTRLIRVRHGKLSTAISEARVATLGSFDGIHLGHRKVLEHVRAEAIKRSLPSALITFHPHPSIALGKTRELPSITTIRQKYVEIQALNIDELIVVYFKKDVFDLDFKSFIDTYLVRLFNVSHLVIGPDARVGKAGEGTSEKISHHLTSLQRSVEVVDFQGNAEGTKIGSRAIREIITHGHVEKASALLGRSYHLSARVVSGDGRGSRIGFPTANLHLHGEVVPLNGVYAGWVLHNGKKHRALANIGTQPTFNGKDRRVEVHIIDGSHELYGSRINFEFIARLRNEKKFDSVEDLKKQISNDIHQARLILFASGN